MPIPIQPISANAVPYTSQIAARGMNIFNRAKEGAKVVPLSFSFASNPAINVNFNTNAVSIISQIACMYVDASLSTHDIVIYFQDTGFSAHVAQGTQQMIPCLTGTGVPSFTVILDDNGQTNATDTCNIFCLNEFLPDFSTSSYQNLLSYGYGQYYELQPAFTAGTCFSYVLNAANLTPSVGYNLIPHTKWYVTGISFDIQGASSSGTADFTLKCFDGGASGTNFLNFGIQLNGTTFSTGSPSNRDINAMNYVSIGSGYMNMQLDSFTNLNTIKVCVNIFGGVLIS